MSSPKPSAGGISPPGTDAYVGQADDPVEAAAPAEVLELAAACVRFVGSRLGIQPDFTNETLPLVDHYVAEGRAALGERPEALPLAAHAVGAYLGEVVRRRHRCWWRLDTAHPEAWRLEFELVLLAFYPVQVAHQLLTRACREHAGDAGASLSDEDAPDDLGAAEDLEEQHVEAFGGFELGESDRDAVAARLAELPPVSEHEYYLPSTRLEVLDIVVEALLACRALRGDLTRDLGPADYR
jgi:hypothetical protein